MTHWFKRVLLYLLPHHPLSRIVQWSARCRRFPLRKSITRWFTRNERVACVFQTEAGPMAVVLVGAIFVGSIETVWAGEITPPRGKRIKVTSYAASDNIIQLDRGEELGRFNMGGSTIIVLFGPGCMKWQSGLVPEMRVQFGQSLGRVEGAPT